MSISLNGLVMMRKYRTCLIHHIDEGLRVVLKEVADCIARILTREDLLNQGGEFMWRKRASDQAFTGWSVEVEKRKVPRAPVPRTRIAKLKAYHS